MFKKLFLLAALAGAAACLVAWPRIGDVETGRTPEYPDLRAQEFAAGEERVAQAVKGAVARMPGWTLVGSGKGPGGSAVTARHGVRWFPFKEDVSVKIERAGGSSRVSIRSRSLVARWDFGQNARNIRALQSELDGALE
jgi:hypothetical protein